MTVDTYRVRITAQGGPALPIVVSHGIDRHRKGGADLAHPVVVQPAKPVDEYYDRHAFN